MDAHRPFKPLGGCLRAAPAAALAALILLASIAVRPSDAMGPPGIDVRGGFTASRFGGTLHGAFPDGRRSGTGGFALSFALGPTLSIRPEIAWISKGGETTVRFVSQSGPTIDTFQLHESWVADYVEVPLMVRWESPPDAQVRPFIVLGPGFAWRTGGRIADIEFTSVQQGSRRVQLANIFEDVSGDVPSRFRRFDVDAIGGIGIAAGRGRVRATIEARHLHGLRNIMPYGTSVTAYQHAFTFVAGLELR
jgi:hypothetical protein